MEKENIEHAHHMMEHSTQHHKKNKKERTITKPIITLMAIVVLVIVLNQIQMNSVSKMLTGGYSLSTSSSTSPLAGKKDLSDINLDELKSTGHTVAAVFPVQDIQTQEDAMAILFPTGTPDYGADLDVSFDDPIGSLDKLSKMYPALRAEVMQNNPEGWQRFMDLASKPLGISCEYCCGVGTIGIRKDGSSGCGCQHNPALLTIALYLSAYSDYNDGNILREVMRWKTLFFPKNMIELGMTVAGGDTSALENLPGMVGGC